MTTRLPTVPFGPHRISRLIVGGNPFCGNSHYSLEMNADMRGYYTDEQAVAVLHRCQAAGINTWQARGDYHRILHWLELFRREGGRLHWIAQTASEMHDLFQNIRVIAAAGAVGIYHHGTWTDKFWQEGRIDQVQEYLKCMRDCGVQVGLGSHMPEVFDYVEDRGWDLDFYMTCFYNLSRQPRESALVSGKANDDAEQFPDCDRDRICQFIQRTRKTCLAFKIMAAGRHGHTQDDARRAFEYAFTHIKPRDAVVVGMFPKYVDQIALNVEHTLAVCARAPAIAPTAGAGR